MTIILGIDPGSRITGYGVIGLEQGKKAHYIASGCVRIGDLPLASRLSYIFEGIQKIIQQYQPHEAAIEQIFFHQNPSAALKLGQARGVAIVATSLHALSLTEYSARQIKQAVVGFGAAKKEQVQEMIKCLLGLNRRPATDAADALAVALCHAHSRKYHDKFSPRCSG